MPFLVRKGPLDSKLHCPQICITTFSYSLAQPGSVQTFPPTNNLIYKWGNYVYRHWEMYISYRHLSYPLKSQKFICSIFLSFELRFLCVL